MPYFPVFLKLEGKSCLVAGGGRVALRKVAALRAFGVAVVVVAPEILPEIMEMEGVSCLRRRFEEGDERGHALAVAATGDAAVNHRVSEACKKAGVLVNAADQIEDCEFLFPAYLKEGEVVAAFTSGGQAPVVAQYLKEQARPAVTPLLGEIASQLGSIRKMAGDYAGTEEGRARMYREILRLGMQTGDVPSREEIFRIMEQYRSMEKAKECKEGMIDRIAGHSERF